MTFSRRRSLMRVMAVVVLGTFPVAACGSREGEQQAPASAPPTTAVVPTTVPPAAPPTTAPTPQAQAPSNLPPAPYAFTPEQLRDLVAPVALYPDVVLASLLPATTFPQQVDEATQWLRAQGGHVDAVPQDRGWDGSVAALLQFPDVLTWLDENRDWEEQMGVAVTYQQGEVLAAIQDFRHQASAAGNLETNQYQVVDVQQAPPAAADGGPAPQSTITIAPAQPDVALGDLADPTQEMPYGAYSYIINGNMVAGAALVGTPAEYRKTGVMTFQVSTNGIVYERAMGPQSLDVAKAMTTFDPAASWIKVTSAEESEAQC